MRSRPECKSSCTPEQREKSPSAQRSSGKKIAYRLLTLVMSQADRLISLTALGMVMLYLEAFSFLRAYPNNQAARKEKYGLFYRRRARSILLVRVAADPRDMLFRERASRPLFPWRFFVPGPSRQAYPRQSATVTQESPAREHL